MRDDIAKRVFKTWVETTRAEMPERIRQCIAWCNADLYFGPLQEDDYPGFVPAVKELKDYDLELEVWVDIDCEEAFTSEPKSYEEDGEVFEPSWENICHYDRKEVRAALYGEVASYF